MVLIKPEVEYIIKDIGSGLNDNRKIISLFETEEKFDPITLGQTIYKQIDDIYNDEEYLKLVEECRITNKVDDTDAIEKI